MPPDAEDIAVLRVVVREGFSRDLADMFVQDLQRAVDHFEGQLAKAEKRTVFSH
jgi:glutamate decarboxylase